MNSVIVLCAFRVQVDIVISCNGMNKMQNVNACYYYYSVFCIVNNLLMEIAELRMMLSSKSSLLKRLCLNRNFWHKGKLMKKQNAK